MSGSKSSSPFHHLLMQCARVPTYKSRSAHRVETMEHGPLSRRFTTESPCLIFISAVRRRASSRSRDCPTSIFPSRHRRVRRCGDSRAELQSKFRIEKCLSTKAYVHSVRQANPSQGAPSTAVSPFCLPRRHYRSVQRTKTTSRAPYGFVIHLDSCEHTHRKVKRIKKLKGYFKPSCAGWQAT